MCFMAAVVLIECSVPILHSTGEGSTAIPAPSLLVLQFIFGKTFPKCNIALREPVSTIFNYLPPKLSITVA